MISDFWRVTPRKRSICLSRKKGVLFHNPGITGKVLFYVGCWLVVISNIFFIYQLYPTAKAYLNYYLALKIKPDNQQVLILKQADVTIAKEAPKINNFEIKIPKIQAKTSIIANISPYDEEKYRKVLELGFIAQSSTSQFPGSGIGKTTYLFAHSSNQGIVAARKNPVFYLLGELAPGDSIWVERNGVKYLYKVFNKKIVGANEIKYLNYSEADKELLILQTCWPVGTDWNRLLIFAQLVAF